MSDNLEVVAIAIHDGWREYKRRKGVTWGEKRTQSTHPHMLEWNKLDLESKNQDRFIASLILEKIFSEDEPASDLPKLIHDSWVSWSKISKENHPHALPFEQAHSSGAEEHEVQAEFIKMAFLNLGLT